MITENVLKEWYTENASRRFPLAALVPEEGGTINPTGLDDSGQVLPNSLLVGIQMIVPRTMLATREAGSTLPYDNLANNYRIYLSSVIISLGSVEIVFSTVSGKDVAKAVWTPTSEMTGLPVHGVAISPLPVPEDPNIGTNKISGYVFLGPDSIWSMSSGVYSYTGDNVYNSMVSESCISADDDGHVTGLVVNGERLTGDITIEAGENASIDVDTTTNTLTINFAAEQVEGIHNKNELVGAVASLYGDPITSIDNIKPDSSGNFHIGTAGDLQADSLDHGLSISASEDDGCCGAGTLSLLLENVQTMNEKSGRLDAFLKSVEAVVNSLQNELAYMKLTARQ